jgi:CRP-like cAMP-binding protein
MPERLYNISNENHLMGSEEDLLHILLSTKVFQGLTNDDLKLFCRYFQKIPFKKNDILIQEGQLRKALHIILRGQVKVFLLRYIEGTKEHRITEVPLAALDEGDCFGEFSLFDEKPASASVIATRPGELIKLTKPVFDSILETNDHIAKTIYHNFVQILITRMRKSDQEYDRLLTIHQSLHLKV